MVLGITDDFFGTSRNNNETVGIVIRNGKIIFPGGDDVMKANDSVIVVTAGRIIEDLHDIFM